MAADPEIGSGHCCRLGVWSERFGAFLCFCCDAHGVLWCSVNTRFAHDAVLLCHGRPCGCARPLRRKYCWLDAGQPVFADLLG